jgi:predicted transcriptional regulator
MKYMKKKTVNLENRRSQETLDAIEDIRMGRVVDGDRVNIWLESWGTENELSPPLIGEQHV